MYVMYIMRRTQIYLDEEQEQRLARRAKAEGTTKSAVIRRAVDTYLAGPTEGRVEEFRRAVGEAAGTVPRLDADYVERMREADSVRDTDLERRRS